MTFPPPGDLRSFVRTWFSPSRWTAVDGFVALAGLVLAVAVSLPWFRATLRIRGSGTTGYLIDPPGTLTGLAAHWYLLVPLAVALLETAVIMARHFPSRRAPRLPFHGYFLVIASGVDFLVVIVGALLRPPAWYGSLQMPDNFYITIDWTYGALVAVAAALLSLVIAVAALRTDAI